jgi:hypothetical protein
LPVHAASIRFHGSKFCNFKNISIDRDVSGGVLPMILAASAKCNKIELIALEINGHKTI